MNRHEPQKSLVWEAKAAGLRAAADAKRPGQPPKAARVVSHRETG